jgi:hypothetical protein
MKLFRIWSSFYSLDIFLTVLELSGTLGETIASSGYSVIYSSLIVSFLGHRKLWSNLP